MKVHSISEPECKLSYVYPCVGGCVPVVNVVCMQSMHVCNLYTCFALATNQAFPSRVGYMILRGQTAIDNIPDVSCVLDGSRPSFVYVAISLCWSCETNCLIQIFA
jgi:hypothetical protein